MGKVAIREKKNAVDERDGVKMSRHFRENKKLFWSDVNRKRNARDQMTMKVRDSEGNMLTEGAKVQQRWREYFEKVEVREAFQGLIVSEWERVKDRGVVEVEEEWELFKSTIVRCAGIVCGYKCVGRKKKGSAWWDEEVKNLVKEKRRLFEVYLADRNDRNKEEYKRKNRQVKVAVRE